MKNELRNTFTTYWNYLALNAACELQLFDKFEVKNYHINDLCEQNNWHFDSLKLLIDFCLENNFIIENPYLKNTDKGKLFISTNENGLYYSCLHWADEHLTAWQNLSFTIQTGKSAFEKIYKMPYFDYLSKEEDRLIRYHKAMGEYATDDYIEITKKLQLNRQDSVLDVGGGIGTLITKIKSEKPNLKCALFDLNEVVNSKKHENIEVFAGDFFVKIPSGFNNLILSRVIHDWDENKSKIILDNCYNALESGGKIHVIENMTDKMDHIPNLLSINMRIICESTERSSQEYQDLLEKAGFKFYSLIQLNSFQFIMSAVKL